MRKHLKPLADKKPHHFTATVQDFGRKYGCYGGSETLLLTDIADDNNKTVATHIWLNYDGDLSKLNLTQETKISFQAYVSVYKKTHAIDYGLFKISNIQIVNNDNSDIHYTTLDSLSNADKRYIKSALNNIYKSDMTLTEITDLLADIIKERNLYISNKELKLFAKRNLK